MSKKLPKNCRVCKKKTNRLGLCKDCTQKYRYPHKPIVDVNETEESVREISHNILLESEVINSLREFILPIPELSWPTEILASFEGPELPTEVIINDKKQQVLVLSGCPCQIDIDNRSKEMQLRLLPEQAIDISFLAVGFTNMEAIRVFLEEQDIIDCPEHSMSVGFDLSSIEECSGHEVILEKQIQIRNPNGNINTFSKSTPNFIWRDKTLICNLPTGYTHAIRVRYKTERQWIKWSNWLTFVPKRKMTL